jgi:hypothetical protein
VRLTPTGLKKLKHATAVAVAAEAAALSTVSAADQKRVSAVLQSLLEGLEPLAP